MKTALLFVPLALLWTSPVFADAASEAAADALFAEGRAAMARGDAALACAKLEASLRIDHGVGTLLNLADCKEALGDLAGAWAHLRRAEAELAAMGDDRLAFARQRLAEIEPRLPRPAAAPAAKERPPSPPAVSEIKAVPPNDAAGARRTWGFVALGAGGATLLGGAIAGALALDRDATLDEACAQPGPHGERVCPASLETDLDELRVTRTLSYIGLGLGASAAGLGVALLWTTPSGGTARVTFPISPGYVGVRCSF